MIFLLQYWKYIALILAVAGSILYVQHLRSEVGTLKVTNATLTSDLAVEHKSVLDLQDAITGQNLAINQLKSDQEARVAAHATELAIAQKTADNYRLQAAALSKRLPDPKKSVCENSEDIINEELRK
jgi:DNA-binding helix-hairpin-helix protein with protein kinase domain